MRWNSGMSHIHLYGDGLISSLSIEEVIRYLKGWMRRRAIGFRGNFFQYHLKPLPEEERELRVRRLAKELARLRIREATGRNVGDQGPMEAEVAYERHRIEQEDFKSFGILYDGFGLLRVFPSLISEDERNVDHCHIIFTNQLLGTWDGNDRRYHARVSVYGFPCVVSTTGVVEGPAKPREFYLKRQLGIPIEILKSEFKGRFIDHGDPRLTEVMKGYAMQAVFFHKTGNPFCGDPDCRLYNAHWQEELIRAQLDGKYEFCRAHRESLNLYAGQLRAGQKGVNSALRGNRDIEK